MRYNKWVSYGVIGFVAYSLLSSHYSEIQTTVKDNVEAIKAIEPTDPEHMAKGTYTERKITNIMEAFVQTETGKKFMSDVIKKAPDSSTLVSGGDVTMLDNLAGSSTPALCGQTVTVHYTSKLGNGKIIDETRTFNRPLTFVLGKGSVVRGLELGILGMRKGGIRKLTVPGSLGYDNPKFTNTMVPPMSTVHFNVELLEVTPRVPFEDVTVHITDTKAGNGMVARCGSSVLMHYTASRSDGTTVFSTKETNSPVTLVLGDTAAPIGLVKGIESMKMGGARTVAMPKILLGTLSGAPTTILPKTVSESKDETIRFDIEVISVY